MGRRFIVDSMLGSTVRWLRLLGFDAEYNRQASDEELLEKAEAGNLVLLTGDVGLYRRALRRRIEAFLVHGEREAERVASLAERYQVDLKVDPSRSRCMVCNVPIDGVEKRRVEGRVPRSVFETYEEFWSCGSCGRVYWLGSHVKKMQSILEEAKRLMNAGRVEEL